MFKLQCTNATDSQTVWELTFGFEHVIYFTSLEEDANGYSNTYYLPELSGVNEEVDAAKIIGPFVLLQLELMNSLIDIIG